MMNKKVEIINEVLYQAELMGLCEFDCNENEYLSEAQDIAEFMDNENPNQEDLRMYVQQLFECRFDMDVDFEDCDIVAECILKNLEVF